MNKADKIKAEIEKHTKEISSIVQQWGISNKGMVLEIVEYVMDVESAGIEKAVKRIQIYFQKLKIS